MASFALWCYIENELIGRNFNDDNRIEIKETKVTDRIQYIDLSKDAWVEAILAADRDYGRQLTIKEAEMITPYDIRIQVKVIENEYFKV